MGRYDFDIREQIPPVDPRVGDRVVVSHDLGAEHGEIVGASTGSQRMLTVRFDDGTRSTWPASICRKVEALTGAAPTPQQVTEAAAGLLGIEIPEWQRRIMEAQAATVNVPNLGDYVDIMDMDDRHHACGPLLGLATGIVRDAHDGATRTVEWLALVDRKWWKIAEWDTQKSGAHVGWVE